MNAGRRLLYILGGLVLLLIVGYFIFTGSQVGEI